MHCLIDKAGHMKETMLLILEFLGCNTVSRLYLIDKEKITKSSNLVNICCDVAPIFYNHLSSKLYTRSRGKVIAWLI